MRSGLHKNIRSLAISLTLLLALYFPLSSQSISSGRHVKRWSEKWWGKKNKLGIKNCEGMLVWLDNFTDRLLQHPKVPYKPQGGCYQANHTQTNKGSFTHKEIGISWGAIVWNAWQQQNPSGNFGTFQQDLQWSQWGGPACTTRSSCLWQLASLSCVAFPLVFLKHLREGPHQIIGYVFYTSVIFCVQPIFD
jgi:hypothetical protein